MSRRSNRRAKRKTADHRDRWMITYADLITLLLIFFVIMYAMSNLDSGKYDVVTQSLQNTFNESSSVLELGDGLNNKPGQVITKTPPSDEGLLGSLGRPQFRQQTRAPAGAEEQGGAGRF